MQREVEKNKKINVKTIFVEITIQEQINKQFDDMLLILYLLFIPCSKFREKFHRALENFTLAIVI